MNKLLTSAEVVRSLVQALHAERDSFEVFLGRKMNALEKEQLVYVIGGSMNPMIAPPKSLAREGAELTATLAGWLLTREPE